MTPIGHTSRRRLAIIGLLTLPLAITGSIWAASAQGAAAPKPSMQVLPKATGLRYGQTVDVKGHHLPKGSGSVAATICGLQDASGKTIAKPVANDCAGAAEVGKLVVVKSWQSNGEFDAQYTLPTSGEKFGKNARFCDRTHHCALVVADANPDKPAYYISTVIQFVDQQPFGAKTTPTTKPKSTTTQPKPTTTTTTTVAPAVALHGSVSGSAGGSSGSGNFSIALTPNTSSSPPTLPAAPATVTIPAPVAQGLDHVCTQLAGAVKQAGGDPSGLLAACSAIESGNGPQELGLVLQSPSLLCVEGASAWQNNQQITDACNQAAAALAPATSQLGSALQPVLGQL